MATSLPNNPDLERFRTDSRRLQRAVREGDGGALALVRRHHPDGLPADQAAFTLTGAQLVVARGYGFPSWPRLRHYLAVSAPLRRDPAVAYLADDADRFCDLACLRYADGDDPQRWADAVTMLGERPDLVASSLAAAVVVGDPEAVRAHLANDRRGATREGGPFRWSPLVYLVYSRVPQRDAIGTAGLLLDAGADPNAGYLWQGLPTPFTALTGCFGEGEQGPGRQPRHLEWHPLARPLLDRGADPNDAQTLYNRMFGRDDSHLELLFDHGLGTGVDGPWRRRLGEALESVPEMMERQVGWAVNHGFDRRLALLARHGFGPEAPVAPVGASVHRVGSPEAVAAAVAAGADVDAYELGRTALHQMAWIGDVEMVLALLRAGADPDLTDETHRTTPLVWAEWACQPATAEILRPITHRDSSQEG